MHETNKQRAAAIFPVEGATPALSPEGEATILFFYAGGSLRNKLRVNYGINGGCAALPDRDFGLQGGFLHRKNPPFRSFSVLNADVAKWQTQRT
jgi:hypothetical protein